MEFVRWKMVAETTIKRGLESYPIGYWPLAIGHCHPGRKCFLPCFSMTNFQ